MKRKTQMAVLSVLIFSWQGAASADTQNGYPADAESNYDLRPADTYADQQARKGISPVSEQWGVGKRQAPTAHNPFPFGGGPVDD